jgi:hypothetical protein
MSTQSQLNLIFAFEVHKQTKKANKALLFLAFLACLFIKKK